LVPPLLASHVEELDYENDCQWVGLQLENKIDDGIFVFS
jgi:hypothetical protein